MRLVSSLALMVTLSCLSPVSAEEVTLRCSVDTSICSLSLPKTASALA